MKKSVCILFLIFLGTTVFSQNFKLEGIYFPNLYSNINSFEIEEKNISYKIETTGKEKKVSYAKINNDGLLYLKLSEKFPKEFTKYPETVKSATDDKILILAGKNLKKDRVLLFGTTSGFFDDYSFIEPVKFEWSNEYGECSSFLKEKNKEYKVDNLTLYVTDTPWIEGAKGDGIGEYFIIKNRYIHNYLLIMNGYISYEKPYLYKQNNRVKKIKVTGCKSKKSKVIDVLDTPHPQTVDISFLTEPEDIRVEIAAVYKGTKYDDTCINYCITYDDEVIPYENSVK